MNKQPKTPKTYMAIDQYGNTFHGLTNPRKDLCEKLGRSHADIIYCDTEAGESVRLGYVIAGLWLEVYEVRPAYREAA